MFWRGVALAISLHFVVGVERSHMPGNVGRNVGEELREATKFVGRVVEAGDQRGYDPKPQSHLVNAADAVEDGGDASAKLMIVAIVEAFEIDFVQIKPGAQVGEHLGSAIAVGNESGEQARALGLLENGYRPFAGDQRLAGGADQNPRALVEGVANPGFGSGGQP